MPRLLAKIFLIAFAVFLIWIIIFHFYFHIKGKEALIQRLQALTGRQATIGSLYTTFPTNVHIHNFDIAGFIHIESLYAAGGFYNPFTKRFGFGLVRMNQPSVLISRKPEQSVLESFAPVLRLFVRYGLGRSSQDSPLLASCYIDRLILDNGNIIFTDRISDGTELVFKAEDLNAHVNNLSFYSRGSRVVDFDIQARVPWLSGSESGKMSLGGWLDWPKRSMQATLKVNNIDAVYLYPYYAQWVDLEKAHIDKAKMQLTSDITGLNNEITAQCRLELTNIVFKPRAPEDENRREEKIANTVLDMFKEQDKMVLTFPIKTQMDNPRFGLGVIKTAVENKIIEKSKANPGMADIVLFPAKVVEGTMKTTTELTKAVIGGVLSLGWELLTPFKKEKTAEQPQEVQPTNTTGGKR